MQLTYLIDTDCVIHHLKGIRSVTAHIAQIKSQGLALSIISYAELWEGAYFSREPSGSQAKLDEFLSGVALLGVDEEIARQFGLLRGTLRKSGKTIGDFDLLIAATALRHGLMLLSNNRKHFENVPGLRIESAAT
ncbi:MAG: type II toxin-antitoxin system VapC family toxin [Acidobacteria bacterium]|nr:type II toxin-antitoxin system VapC family toxin [Acidobacteriota bacterium]MCL5286851.1 type II toxin-antitoxin system VapC family toxin [Acidobacteriota bacterium]